MPELPEVEARRQVAEKHLLGKTLKSATAAPDSIVFEGVTPGRVERYLRGRTIRGVGRKGKHLWLELDRRPWLTLHFGMGGSFTAYRDVRERPRFWKLELRALDGTRLAMTNPRRLGRIRLLQDPLAEPPLSLLGPDPLVAMPSAPELALALAARKAPIKAVLLDQGFLAGIGNWIADEVLYQARIAPGRPARSLTPAETARLRARILSVIRRAVEVGADDAFFPRGWLFHVRWGKDPEARTQEGLALRFTEVGGRTTAWVPSIQK
jgi:formamidopyrimidine-DNA glycosylase